MMCYYCLMPHLYEKSWPEKRGYPLPLLSAKVNLSERLHEKNLIPVGANSAFWLSRHDRVDRAVQAKVFIWRKVGSAWWPYNHKRLTHLQLSHLFVSCVNGLPCFVSNYCMKSSIVQSSAVALVTLYYPGKVFSARSARFWETCPSSMAVLQIPGKIVLNLNFHLALVLP